MSEKENLDQGLESLKSSDGGLRNTALPPIEVDLGRLCLNIWYEKRVVMIAVLVAFVVSVVYSLSLPNIYKSDALLMSSEESSGGGLAAMAGQLGGLATLAGVNLNSGSTDKTLLALEVLKSREFISMFVDNHSLVVPLLAAEGWNAADGIKIDPDLYNQSNSSWEKNKTFLSGMEPSAQEIFNAFIRRLKVSEDKKTGFISISFESYSPLLSKEIVDLLVTDVNSVVKSREVSEARKSIDYLTSQLSKTNVAQMQAVFYELIQEQTKTIMLAEIRDEYVFKTIDPAVVPELKHRPKRALIVVFALMFGGFVGLTIAVIRIRRRGEL